MDERATHVRLHELYSRLHPETGDHALTWREGLREFLEALGAHEALAGMHPAVAAQIERLGLRTREEVERAAGPGGIMGAEGPGQPPTT